MELSLNQLAEALCDVPRAFPRNECSSLASADAKILETIGVPEEFADWFRAAETLQEAGNAIGVVYEAGGETHTIARACTVALNDLGSFVIDGDTGAVVYVNDDRSTCFVNSSVRGMLFCIAQFLQSDCLRYTDAEERLLRCREADPTAFDDVEGPWAVLFEEAIAGMY